MAAYLIRTMNVTEMNLLFSPPFVATIAQEQTRESSSRSSALNHLLSRLLPWITVKNRKQEDEEEEEESVASAQRNGKGKKREKDSGKENKSLNYRFIYLFTPGSSRLHSESVRRLVGRL